MCSDFSKHILLPIVFYLDASNVDKNGRLQVNPLTFTLGIFKRSIRNQARAWRTIGYIDDHLNYLDNDVRKELKSVEKVQDVHAILAFVLQETGQKNKNCTEVGDLHSILSLMSSWADT